MKNPKSPTSNLGSTPRAASAIVDDALRTYPLAPTPPGLSKAVMARIRTLSPAPRFRLAWLDYAICLAAASMVAVILIFWQAVPPQALDTAQYQASFFFDLLSRTAFWPALAAGVVLGGITLAAILVLLLIVVPTNSRRWR